MSSDRYVQRIPSLIVGEKGREVDGSVTELVTRGGGNWAAF